MSEVTGHRQEDAERAPSPGVQGPVRIAVIVPVWKAAEYMAGAVDSALAQDAPFGVGVVIVDDGCPEPETEPIGRALRDANPDRVEFLRQANGGVSAARNAGIRCAIRRWPEVEAFFPLDADNLLSPQTMAAAFRLLEENPELAWSSPALERFGISGGVWNVVGPHLPYRQLFANQSDSGTLFRRTIFEAGIEFDETMRKGFEDWEFYLRAGLAGFRGAGAGLCGFRYRTLPESMLVGTQRREEEVKTDIRERNAAAYRAGALSRREHAEAPRFALVRCDRADALLVAAADLEPRRVPLAALCGEEQPATVIVLTTTAEVERLIEERLLAGLLLRLQVELHKHQVVALNSGGERVAVATTPAALGWIRQRDGELWIDRTLEFERTPAGPLSAHPVPLGEVLDALCIVPPRPTEMLGSEPHGAFFAAMHLGRLETTVPWAGQGDGRTLVALATTSAGEAWEALSARVAEARATEVDMTAHLVLADAPLNGEPPPAGFDTATSLGGADRDGVALLIEHLRARADLFEDTLDAAQSAKIAE
jgi:Glycosyl transferase family 2